MLEYTHLTFGSILRRRSRVLDNFFNYQFDMIQENEESKAAPERSLSLNPLTHPDENDHWIAYLADKTQYRRKKIALKSTYGPEHPILVFGAQGALMYSDMNPEKIKKIRYEFDRIKKIDSEQKFSDEVWFIHRLSEQGFSYGWVSQDTLKVLQPSKREKHAVIFLLAVPQVGFINAIAAVNLTLAVLGTTLLTPYYVYACHFAVTVAQCKSNNGGRILSPEVRSIIERDSIALGAQTFVATAFAAFIMHTTVLEWPSVYESIQVVLGHFKPVIINGIPLDVHLALIVTSGIFIGAISLYITWLRNNDNPNFKAKHYSYTLALGFFIGFGIYAATMMPGLGNFMSNTTFAGFAEGAAILLYGAGLHKLASVTARPALAAVLKHQPGQVQANTSQHGLIEPYIEDQQSLKCAVTKPTTFQYNSQNPKDSSVRPRSHSCPHLTF